MSIRGLVAITFVFAAQATFAQPPSRQLKVLAGEDVTKVMPLADRYRFPEFRDGQLVYPQGLRSEVLQMNYNILIGAMQFIDAKGDTMYIAEDSNIFKYIQVGKTLFYHDYEQGYFEIITRESPVKLLAQTRWKVIRREMLVNNGYTTTASIGNTEFTSRRSDENSFVTNENTLYGLDVSLYLLANRDQIYKVTKSNLFKAFPDQKRTIKKYLSDKDVDLRNEEHVREMLTFCNGLVEDI